MARAGEPSFPYPLGVTITDGGVNVALFSSVAESVVFSTFDAAGSETRHPLPSVDSDIWHGFVPGVGPGQTYGFRVAGPHTPATGARCNPAKLLLDPYGKAVAGNLDWRPSWNGAVHGGGGDIADPSDSGPDAPRSVVVDPSFDWEGDVPLGYAPADTVVYELHVKGFTQQHPDVPPADRGTYAGLAHPSVTGYLQRLGVTAVELLPVHQSLTSGLLNGAGLRNYWGYDTIAFFSPHQEYSSARRAGAPPGSEVAEFKTMVKALHRAGIEVILDVVFNHTAEGNELGPTLCLRGIDNAAYYQLVPGRPEYYDNLTGCGNTINAASPAVRRLIVDSLRYWVEEMHVDGFRFDLAAVLGSDEPATGSSADPGWDRNAAFFDLVLQDPTLARTKLIAEPWTAAGNEQDQFPPRWAEWNGQYRDVMRDFWRGQVSSPRWVGARFAGSPDMYATSASRYGLRRHPPASINFVTCHDGFTLADLVSYDDRHNDANLTDPGSGTSDNRSWNCGQGPADDGPTHDDAVATLRRRQQRNLLATLVLSRGVPMLQAGDERSRTQHGNNNAWCLDNPLSWVDWTPDPTAEELTGYTARLIALRTATPALRAARFPEPGAGDPSEPVVDTGLLWFSPSGVPMTAAEWDTSWVRSFAVVVPDVPPGRPVLVMANAYWGPVTFTVPAAPGGPWTVTLDTTEEDGAPRQAGVGTAPLGPGATVEVGPRSLIAALG